MLNRGLTRIAGHAAILLTLSAAVAPGAGAQERRHEPQMVEIAAGPRYAPRSDLHLTMLGVGYRDLWTTPIRAPVLDLSKFAGGLTPVRRGGSVQTRALRFAGKDGREYNFRSIDKELTPSLPEFARETFVDWVRQDMTSLSIPTAPVIVAALMDSVGILNPGPRVYVLPDDPALGEFREEFAGMLGTLEVHPDEGENDEPLFAGAAQVSGTEELLEHLLADLDHRVDARAFLKARLVDVLLGDFDRHADQWRWARYERGGLHWWVPVPEDRDYAFVDHRGLSFSLGRSIGLARLVTFEETFPPMLAMLDNSLLLTRRLLAELSWEDWEETLIELMPELTDACIRAATMTLPPSHFDLRGERLIATLAGRRDRLPEAARELYEILSEVVEVHGTREDDLVRIVRQGTELEVQLFTRAQPSAPRFQRVVDPAITREVRVHLHDGDDEALVVGAGADVTVRVIGNKGNDRFFDRSSGPTSFHDAEGENEFGPGAHTYIDRRPWTGNGLIGVDPPEEREPEAVEPPAEEQEGEELELEELLPGLELDWGQSFSWFSPAVDWRSHAQLVLGGGPRVTHYGFRQLSYRSRAWLQGLVAPLAGRVGVEAGYDVYRSNSTRHLELLASVSGLEATTFHGLGNDTPAGPSDDFRVWERTADLALLAHLWDRDDAGLYVGGRLEYIDPESGPGARPDIPADELGAALRAGTELRVHYDARDDRVFPRSGSRLEARSVAYPGAVAGGDAFARIETEASVYAPLPFGVLALRAGGGAVFGDYPFYDAVFLGGTSTLRGYHHQRLAGDRSAYTATELRVPLTSANLLVRGTLGISVFADLGRVWVDGDSPGGWHSAVGANAWFYVPVGAVTIGYARGEENRLSVRLGMPF